jgi:two-component system, LytTR family, response regulator
MIEAVIIEDEKRSANFLKNLVKEYCPDVVLLGEATSVKSGLELIQKAKPTLVFQDIEMPDGTAFDLLEQIHEKNFHIIFTTAYDHYALRAIKFSALDYLLKPINFLELQAAVEKLKSKNLDASSLSNINMLIKNLSLSAEKSQQKIALPTMDGHIFVNVDDIIRFEAEGGYTYVFLSKGGKILISRTLKDFEEFVNEDDFVRIHHSHLINIKHVKKYVKGSGGYVIMDDGSEVEVSVRKKDEFFKKMHIR